MKNILLLFIAICLFGCGGGEVVKTVIEPVIEPDDTASIFFNVDMYQNGETSIQYESYGNSDGYNENSSKHNLNLKIINHSISENKTLQKLVFTDESGAIHSEYYLIDMQEKLIMKVEKSILYKDNSYKTFNYGNQYVNFNFNLKKYQEDSKEFNVSSFNSVSHESTNTSIKVTTKYLGLDEVEVRNTIYNTGKFEITEESSRSKIVDTIWFNIDNGVIVKKKTYIHDSVSKTTTENSIDILNSSISFDLNYNDSTFSKFKLNILDGSLNETTMSKENIRVYKGVNDPIIINIINDNIKVDSYLHNNTQFSPENVVSSTFESHSGGTLSSFISKVIYSRECEYNCDGPRLC